MPRIILFLLTVILVGAQATETERLGMPITKPSVLVFADSIVDVELGNPDYAVKIKGKNLLIFAKSHAARPTTLFVRYGEEAFGYVAEIYPDDKAPLQRLMHRPTVNDSAQSSTHLLNAPASKNQPIFTPNEKQAYYNYGCQQDGIKLIVTHIMHQGDATYLQVFIENQTTTNLSLAHFTFEYVSYIRKWLLFKSQKTQVVTPLIAPKTLELKPQTAQYVIFAIPSYISNGGLKIYLGESSQGERAFTLSIPNKVLLQAKRK